MVELWKRKESEISQLWTMNDFKGDDNERSDFRADYIIDPDTKLIMRRSYTNSSLRRALIELPIILVAVASIVACFVGNREF